MNTKLLVPIVFLTAMILCAQYCAGQSSVFYGANSDELVVVFVDTNLSAKVKSAIVADLNLCLGEWGKTGELYLRNKEGSAGYLSIGTTSPHYPETSDFPKNVVSNGTLGVALQISKDLSDAYVNAFAFAVANSNAVKAAYEFVKFVSSTNFDNVSPKQISNYVLYRNEKPKIYEQTFSVITNSLRMQTYYPPSILGFYYSAEGPAASNLWMRLPSSSPGDDVNTLNWNSFPSAIWHNGKWKFCAWE